ncbi:hypothetical protein Pcinc_035317 [Petrolisthes cinctipes]|uniref:Laminin G domain-containing protein n=1 Tax=Petrolisthes cinctipes TaxID=88211 RepID=A0AAE1C049_PETCI|nr:hypothetical protein Pcinc_035317 [Petrolisthes cinctipes]
MPGSHWVSNSVRREGHQDVMSVAWCHCEGGDDAPAAGASEWQVAVLTWGAGRQVWWGGRDELVRQQLSVSEAMGAQNWLWWCLALVLAATRTVSGFLMEGSPTSFTQFPRWVPGANGSLEFEFATREPNGLLLYTDDGGSYEFFELKLVEGSVRLHYNLGGGARLLTVGHGLNDGSWHRVKVSRSQDRTHLTVDNKSESRLMKALSPNFGSPETNSFVYLGGLPLLLTRQVGSRLTLPVVTLEPRFSGSIRGLVYTTNDGLSRSQNIIASQVRPPPV